MIIIFCERYYAQHPGGRLHYNITPNSKRYQRHWKYVDILTIYLRLFHN